MPHTDTHFSSFLSTFGAISWTPHEINFRMGCSDLPRRRGVAVWRINWSSERITHILILLFSYSFILIIFLCWIAGRRHACRGGSMQSHKNKDSLYGRKSLESGRIEQIVYKYSASPAVRSIDFIIQCTIPKRFIPQVDIS
jgi:hypothetical protein